MQLTEAQRALIERALDAMALRADAAMSFSERRDYQRAVAIVRELPAGAGRRVRSDFNGRRELQPDLPIVESAS